MSFNNLQQALEYINSLHHQTIDLGLDRVALVAERLNLLNPRCPVITVAGTNGKGSTVAGLESILLAAGFQVGTFTSPFLYRFNEQIRVLGKETPDDVLLKAFEKIEMAREETSLTPFEFTTLAAFEIFKLNNLDVWILEVGLGGRLDAVNVLNPDVAIVTSIAMDHMDRLGDTREKIGYEKAGIFRSNRPAICGDFDPPKTLIARSQELSTPLFKQGEDFGFTQQEDTWTWWHKTKTGMKTYVLPIPKLGLQNMACVLMAIEILQSKLTVSHAAMAQGLSALNLHGRIQYIPGKVETILDVSHNPAAATWLARALKRKICKGKTRAIFSMLSDKDISATLQVMKESIDEWWIAPLDTSRGASLAAMLAAFKQTEIEEIKSFDCIKTAFQNAQEVSSEWDRIVVFGSFYTVAAVNLNSAVEIR